MRVLVAACLVLAICFNVENSLARPGIPFSIKGATSNSYRNFISAVRSALTSGVTTVNDIPVHESKRFVYFDLYNLNGDFVIFAIDVVNLNLVAYQAGDKSYFLKDAPVPALNTLFPHTSSFYLPFTSSYTDLEKAASHSRWVTPLGLTPLDNAITELLRGESKAASSLLVTIQMVLGAARSRIVEQRVRDSIQDQSDFLPDSGMLGQEDNWPARSLEIQRAFRET